MIATVKYRAGYKYQLAEDWQHETKITGQAARVEPWIQLDDDGCLTLKAGYAWDGASGPTVDEPARAVIPASLVHDALYQLMRAAKLSLQTREAVDDLFYEMLVERGMNRIRAWLWWRAVRKFAVHAALPRKSLPREA